MARLNKEDSFCLLGLFLAWLVFFYELIFQEVLFFYRDIIRYYQPLHFFAAENLQRGIFPFWNPYVSTGMPFFASSQHAMLYPVNLITYLFPFFPAFKYFFLWHFLLGGIGIYLLLKSLDLKPLSCLLGSLIFCYSGYLPSTVNLLTTLSAAVWVGFVILFFQNSLKGNYFWAVCAAVGLVFEFYGGQPEIMYMNILILVLFCLWRHPSEYIAGFSRLAVCGLITLVLTLPQLIPLRELLDQSVRDNAPVYANSSMWSLHPLELIGTVLHHFRWDYTNSSTWFRQRWLRDVYLGILPLFFGLFAYRYKQWRRWALLFTLLGLLGLFWSLGKFTPIHYWFFKFFPLFKSIRYPVKFYFLVQLAVTVLAAIGLQSFQSDAESGKGKIGILGTLLLMTGAGFIIAYLARNLWLSLLVKTYLPHLDQDGWQKLYSLYLPQIWADYFWQWLSLLALLVLLSLRKTITGNWWQLSLGVLICLNVAYISFGAEPTLQTGFYRDRPQIVHFLKEQLGYGRYLYNNQVGYRSGEAEQTSLTIDELVNEKLPLLTQMGLPYHFFDADAYDSIFLRKMDNYLGILKTQENFSDSRLADMLGIRYIFTRKELRENSLKLITSIGSLKLYENKAAQPRAVVIRRFLTRSTVAGTLVQIAARDFQPGVEAVSGFKPEPGPTALGNQMPETIRVNRYDTNLVALTTEAATPGFLVLYDYNYPGWQAMVNGRNAPIYDADYIFRMVPVPAGRAEIIFTYWPTGFSWSIGVFLAAAISLTLIAARVLKQSERG